MRADMRLLVTGASGFIGTNAIEHARSKGVVIAGLDIVAPRCASHAGIVAEVDILDLRRLRSVIRDFAPTHVLHLAARTDLRETRDLSGYAANIEGVANLLEVLEQFPVERAVIASSMLVCRNGYRPSGDADVCPNTLYGESKVRTEEIVRAAPDLPWTIVRPTSIWGPWFAEPYRDFFLAVARRRYVKPGRTRVHKAMGFVGNVLQQIDALMAAPLAEVRGQTFYVSDYEPYVLDDWADEIAAELGRPSPPRVPTALLRGAGLAGDLIARAGFNAPITSFRLGNMLTSSSFDLARLAGITGPQRFPRREGIRLTLEWMRAANQI